MTMNNDKILKIVIDVRNEIQRTKVQEKVFSCSMVRARYRELLGISPTKKATQPQQRKMKKLEEAIEHAASGFCLSKGYYLDLFADHYTKEKRIVTVAFINDIATIEERPLKRLRLEWLDHLYESLSRTKL